MKDSLYRNSSGCYDPTAGEAMAKIIREERKEQKKRAAQMEKQVINVKQKLEKTEVPTDENNGL